MAIRSIVLAREYFIQRYEEWLVEAYVMNCWQKRQQVGIPPSPAESFVHVIESRQGQGCLECLAYFEAREPNWRAILKRREEIERQQAAAHRA